MVRRGVSRDMGPWFGVPTHSREAIPSPVPDEGAGAEEEGDPPEPAAGPQAPDVEPVGKYDRSLSPPAEGRWADRGVLPAAPIPAPSAELDQLLEKEVLGKAKKVYIVHPGPWPGVYLSWTSVSE